MVKSLYYILYVYYLPEDSSSWEFVFLVMKGQEALRLTRRVEIHLGNVLNAGEISGTISLLYETLNNFISGGINNAYINSCLTYRLFMTLFGEIPEFHNKLNIENEGRFFELTQFLRDNLHRDIPVKEMAEIMNLSRSHFTRLFQEEMNTSPRTYLADLRLKTAIELLFNEPLSVKEVAAHCGFNDENYFCRLFKKHYGLSPGRYKEFKQIELQALRDNVPDPI